MRKARNDLITSIVIMVVCAVYFYMTFLIRQTALIAISSAFIPRVCAICLLLLALIMFLRSINAMKATNNSGKKQTEQKNRDDKAKLTAAIVAFIVLTAGILLMEHVGFVYGMVVYLLISFYCFSKYERKNWVMFIALAVLVPVVIYLIFTQAFTLRLPAGILGIGGGIL